MRILLISTYELGRQPVHLASPAASLRAAGHEVRTVDSSIEELTSADVVWADRVGISVPMHTATRIADEVVRTLRAERPELPVCLYGLYAGVASEPVDVRFEGEYEPALLDWAEGADIGDIRHLGRSKLRVLDRAGLPDLDSYARLDRSGSTRLVGAVEASHGCRHRCRHCPIPAIYDGRIRIVSQHDVLADIENLVAAGATHITFGDADFLNAPAHSLAIIESAHRAHPGITFDATIKVEHLVDHADLLERLAAANLLFVVSAFESVDPATIEILDKGHTVHDMVQAVDLVRRAGIYLRPTWLPFFPWTEPGDVADIFEFLDENDLVPATDPVQLAIKLLVPRGSLLEAHPALFPHLKGYDEAALTWRWDFADGATAVLYEQLQTIAADASDCGQEIAVTLNQMREVVGLVSRRTLPPLVIDHEVPRLTESWYCCAEPTRGQAVSVSIGR